MIPLVIVRQPSSPMYIFDTFVFPEQYAVRVIGVLVHFDWAPAPRRGLTSEYLKRALVHIPIDDALIQLDLKLTEHNSGWIEDERLRSNMALKVHVLHSLREILTAYTIYVRTWRWGSWTTEEVGHCCLTSPRSHGASLLPTVLSFAVPQRRRAGSEYWNEGRLGS